MNRLWFVGPRVIGWLVVIAWVFPAVSFGAITVDGLLDESEWADAIVYQDFVTVEPLTGDTAKYATEVRMITTQDGIFVGFTNYQPASVPRVNRRFARDAQIDGDRNIVSFDFDGNAEAGYDFTVSSANSRQDGILGPASYSGDWDGDWYSQTSSNEEYWYSEIHIPWTVAPMSDAGDRAKDMAVWFSRVVYGESLRFAFPNAHFSRNTFMEDWHPIKVDQVKTSTLNWFPYASYSKALKSNDSDNSGLNGGLDVVWRPSSSTQVTAAINPDFGQVESDDLVVNFSAFETYVDEKRPFFTENQSLFDSAHWEDQLLYSRRIGGGAASGAGELVDIDLAVKLTHFGKSLDMGLFVVSEDKSDGSFGGDFLSSRIQRKVDALAIGHSLTYIERSELAREATVQAVDMNWYAGGGAIFRGQVLYSDIQQQTRRANGQIAEDSQDFASWLSLDYSPSDEWNNELYMAHYGDQFDMNDMGFMKRNDFNEFHVSSRQNRLSYDESSGLLSSYRSIEYNYLENNAGDGLGAWIGLEYAWTFRSTRGLKVALGSMSSGWDDRISRGHGLYARPRQFEGSIGYLSARGDDYVYRITGGVNNDGTKKLSSFIDFRQTKYLTQTVTIGSELGYEHLQEWLIWDADVEQLGLYQAESFYADVRLDWYPSSRQEVRLKFQWSGIDATVLGGYQLGSSGKLISSVAPSSDFSVSDTSMQLRYRFELAPLSDIFVVYSRGGTFDTASGDEGAKTLLSEGWRGLQVESLILKIRYRI